MHCALARRAVTLRRVALPYICNEFSLLFLVSNSMFAV